jgi:hypothetical protein
MDGPEGSFQPLDRLVLYRCGSTVDKDRIMKGKTWWGIAGVALAGGASTLIASEACWAVDNRSCALSTLNTTRVCVTDGVTAECGDLLIGADVVLVDYRLAAYQQAGVWMSGSEVQTRRYGDITIQRRLCDEFGNCVNTIASTQQRCIGEWAPPQPMGCTGTLIGHGQ